uniref:WW domain-containing protein n=1 Tax=Eptatretus burgeri TaxID=7764 RepID=A0A8C4NNW8_EPTBU
MQEKPVPEGWERRQIRSSGSFYFYNRTTNSSQWKRPGQVTMQQLMELSQGMIQKMDTNSKASLPVSGEQDSLGKGWKTPLTGHRTERVRGMG